MQNTAQAILQADWGQGRTERQPVQFNPTELTFEKRAQYGEITIPGLDAPLQQYVRGLAETLNVELFFDTTEDGMGAGARSVTEETDKVFRLIRMDGSSHAPPVVTFSWNDRFPGSGIAAGTGSGGNQNRNSFKGVATSLRQRFTLFSSEGIPLRATLTLSLLEFRPLETQLAELGRSSPDRTHGHVLAEDETLSGIAARYYGQPRNWRAVARENRIEDPRRLRPGRLLSIPAIT